MSELTNLIKSLPLAVVLFCGALSLSACGGGGSGGDSGGSTPPTNESPGDSEAPGDSEEPGEDEEEPQDDAHPDFYDSGLRKNAPDTTLVVGTGASVPTGLHTSTTSFKAGSYYSYLSTDDSSIRIDNASASRPLKVSVFNAGTSAAEDTAIRLSLDTDGKIVQSLLTDDGWTYPVVKESGFTQAELGASGIPGRWLGTWVSVGDSGVGSTNDWSLMHVNNERVVQVNMYSESNRANPEINLTCVVEEVFSPQEFMADARARRTERISGVPRAVSITVGGGSYAKKRLPTQAGSSTNFTQDNYEDFDLAQLHYGLTKDRRLRSELCGLTLAELSAEELRANQGRDLLSGLTPALYEDFDWDQCLGMPTRNPAERDAARECLDGVESKQNEIDELISQSTSDVWRTTYPQVTKTPFQLYNSSLSDIMGADPESICDFKDPDCMLIYSLLWLHSQREMMQVADMHFLKVPEVQELFAQYNILAVPQNLYMHWQETLTALDQSIESLRTQGLLPESGVDVVLPSDVADPRYDGVSNSEIATDRLTDYRYALNTYRDPNNTDDVRLGVMEEFFGGNVTSLNGVLEEGVGAEVELDVDMRREVYEYNEWLEDLAEQQRENNSSWDDYRQNTGTVPPPPSDNTNLAFEAWCSEHPAGCGCPNYSCVSEDNTCACIQ